MELTQRELRECRANLADNKPKVTDEEKRKQPNATNTDSEIIYDLKNKFAEIGIKLNAELIELIKSRPYEQVINALSVVKENLAVGSKVRSKPGLFRRALEKAWSPNESDSEREANAVKSTFAEWYDLARNYGIVIGSREEDGVLKRQSSRSY